MRDSLLLALAVAATAGFGPTAQAMSDGVLVHPADNRVGLLFGTSVAISGDLVAIGAASDANAGNGTAGAVFLYRRNGAAWPQETRPVANDSGVGDNLGAYVEAQGDEVFAGAPPHAPTAGGIKSGAVYVFARGSDGNWTQAQELLPNPPAANGRFGQRFVVQNDTLLVNGIASSGQAVVYQFTRQGGQWFQTDTLAPQQGGNFANHISLDRDVAVFGASSAPNDSGFTSGVAYVFTRANGLWSQTARLMAPDGASGDSFGFSVSVSGDTAVVGAYRDDVGTFVDQGSAHVFRRGSNGWAFVTTLLAPDGIGGDGFGKDVRICDKRIYVGASNRSEGGNSKQGVVYRWDSVGGTWTYADKFTMPAPGLSNALFGDHLGVSATGLVVGTPFADEAYVYDGGCAVDAIFGDAGAGSFE